MLFNVGDPVRWESQSSGSWVNKSGVVVEIIKPGTRPDAKQYGLDVPGCGRDHESYVVAVKAGKTDRAKPKHYWPRVSALKPA